MSATDLARIASKQRATRRRLTRRRPRTDLVKKLGHESVKKARALDFARNDEFERFVKQHDEDYAVSCAIIEAAKCEAKAIIERAQEEADAILHKTRNQKQESKSMSLAKFFSLNKPLIW
jgi:cell division septum initiation protein DivIVA